MTIIGAGSWGTTLAVLLAEKGCQVKLWARSRDVYNDITLNRKNSRYTQDVILPEKITAFTTGKNGESKEIFSDSEIIIFSVPSHALREIITRFSGILSEVADYIKAVVNVAKGLELETHMRLSEVMEKTLPVKLKDKIAFLSGPNIAMEILKKLPSVSTVSSGNEEILNFLQKVFTNEYFRVYTNSDLAGVEICAAVKNIIAIAAGISDGLGYGSNTKASLITRGLHELSKVGLLMGARPETFSGIAGMGDLITTCISPSSRNRMVGERLAKGESMDEIKERMYMVAEGINTTKVLFEISVKKKIDLPITESVYNIIYRGLKPEDSVKQLMSRKFKSEV